MNFYKDLGRNSGVSAYEIGADYIKVAFKTGGLYEYDYNCPGAMDVEIMKSLAIDGQGLNSYIGRIVRKRFARRLA